MGLDLLVLLVGVFWVGFEGLKHQYVTEGTCIGRLCRFAWLLPVPVLEPECLPGNTEALLVSDGVVLHHKPPQWVHLACNLEKVIRGEDRGLVMEFGPAVATTFNVMPRTAKYWCQKLVNPSFHPCPYWGFEYQYIIIELFCQSMLPIF